MMAVGTLGNLSEAGKSAKSRVILSGTRDPPKKKRLYRAIEAKPFFTVFFL